MAPPWRGPQRLGSAGAGPGHQGVQYHRRRRVQRRAGQDRRRAATYAISGGLTVSGAVLRPSGTTIRLTIAGGNPLGNSVTTPNTVRDIDDNAAAQDSKLVTDALVVDAGTDVNSTIGQAVVL